MGEPQHGVEYRIHLTYYAAGDDGTIWSYKTGKWVQMKIIKRMLFYDKFVRRQIVPGEFILGAFGTPKPYKRGKPRIVHLDGDETNFRLENITWMRAKGTELNGAILTTEEVNEIRERHKNGEHTESIQMDYPVKKAQIKSIIKNRKWKE